MPVFSNPTTTSTLPCGTMAPVEAIYAESSRDTVQQYPDKGVNASLNTIIDNTLGGSDVF